MVRLVKFDGVLVNVIFKVVPVVVGSRLKYILAEEPDAGEKAIFGMAEIRHTFTQSNVGGS